MENNIVRKQIMVVILLIAFLVSFAFVLCTEQSHAVSLKGKKVLVEGDSIQTSEHGKFLEKTAKQMGAKSVTNKAVKGSTIAYNPDGNVGSNSVWYRISKMSKAEIKKYNVYLISAGTNDWYSWSSVKMGQYNKNNEKTMCGAANCICDRIWKYNKSARIIFVSPIYRYQNGNKVEDCDNVYNKYGKTLYDYRCALYNVAAWHGANVVCGDHISKKSEAKSKKYLKDYLHPTTSYSNTLANRAKNEIIAIKY